MSADAFLAMAFSQSALASTAVFFALMGLVAVIEIAIPLHVRSPWNKAHLIPNFVLTSVYVLSNLIFTAALVLLLLWLEAKGFGLLNAYALGGLVELAIALLVLDFQAYAIHVAMHKRAALWRFHRVHHADPAVDVTTTLRQHPGESVLRFLSLVVFAGAIGASPAAFALYRLLSGAVALGEHANIRLPIWLDSLFSLVIATPNYHKVHHSRVREQTDSNFANIFSIWDRLFFTATPARHGVAIDYGLDGLEPGDQTAWGLFALPFRDRNSAPRATEDASRQEGRA